MKICHLLINLIGCIDCRHFRRYPGKHHGKNKLANGRTYTIRCIYYRHFRDQVADEPTSPQGILCTCRSACKLDLLPHNKSHELVMVNARESEDFQISWCVNLVCSCFAAGSRLTGRRDRPRILRCTSRGKRSCPVALQPSS